MHKPNFAEAVETIIARDPRYDADAYQFVREGLDVTLKMLRKTHHTGPVHRHVSGPELLDGLRKHALDQFGPMAKTVLEHWGVKRCEDFGEIVFSLVEHGVLGKTAEDRREDFRGGYSFDEAFVRPFRPTHGTTRRQHSARHVSPPAAAPERRHASDSEKLSGGAN